MIFSFGCSKSDNDLKLINYGPPVHAKKDFNLQASGENAIWMKAEGAKGGDTIAVIDGTFLYQTSVMENGNVVTVAIPKDFYQVPGTHKLYLLSKKTQMKSNEIDFEVLP